VPLYIIETVVTFRERYAIEAKSVEDAEDFLSDCIENRNMVDPIHSEAGNESLVSVIEIDPKDIMDYADEYVREWIEPDRLVTKVIYDNE